MNLLPRKCECKFPILRAVTIGRSPFRSS